MTVVEIATGAPSPENPKATAEFKITTQAAALLRAHLTRRVRWHEIAAAVLILAALAAIAGGIALIFYAGELAKIQRSVDVTGLIEHVNELTLQRDQIEEDTKNQVDTLTNLDGQIRYDRNQMSELQRKISAATTDEQRRPIQEELQSKADDVALLNKKITDRDATIAQLKKSADERITPIDGNIKQLEDQISGSSTVLEYNSILIRVAAVLLIVFLVQTFISVFRYMTRLAAYYQARNDALRLTAEHDISISDLRSLTSIFSPEAYDFGRAPRTPTEQALDLARSVLANHRKID